jgi:UDP-N-acetylglucosamine 2-epimerase
VKIANIVGARPQFIKYFPVAVAIKNYENTSGKGIKDILIHTGQHYDYTMSKIFFDELGIREPDYHLGIGSGSHGEQTGLALQRVENVLLKERPDIVLVYGDTNSTLSGALAASKLHIPIAHVEAGLRSYNKYMPEEINRVLTDHVSSVLLCPTEVAVKNLQKEGFTNIISDGRLYKVSNQRHNIVLNNASDPSVINIGDVMYDVVQYAIGIAMTRSKIMEQLQINSNDYCLLTLHRAENIDNQESLEGIIDFVNDVSANKRVIFPVHPRAKKVFGSSHKKFSKNVTIIDPVGYFDMLILLKNSELAFTDSGGLQKEAYWLKVPCITLRKETEWVETIQSGWNILFKDYNGQHSISDNDDKYYGDGKAAERIISIMCQV